jgi:adenylyltransferase/sulfurtransferase
VGSIQASEAVKSILGSGRTLRGRLLLFDALEMRFKEVKLEKSPDCPVCGLHPTITSLLEYDLPCSPPQGAVVPELAPAELKRQIDAGADIFVLDVRERHEFEISNVGGELIPMGEIPARAGELDNTRATVVVCRDGIRSALVVAFLQHEGFENVWSLRGGINAWAADVDPSIPRY